MPMTIDFDSLFKLYVKDYIKSNPNLKPDDADILAEELYDAWLRSPSSELGGVAPEKYFAGLDAQELIDRVIEYIRAGMHTPDPLSIAITDKKDEVGRLLLEELFNNRAKEVQLEVIELLKEIQYQTEDIFLKLAADENTEDEVADSAAEALMQNDQNIGRKALELLNSAVCPKVIDRLCDIVCENETQGAFEQVSQLFEKNKDKRKRAFYASCLGKLGDQRAISLLEEAIKRTDLTYFEYVAIRDAIEQLGGQIDIDREFPGDTDYELLKGLDE